MAKKTARDIDVHGKRVLVRVDFNVPRDKSTGEITDDSRVQAALPTIRYLIEQGAKIILCSHLGRPKGEVKEELRLSRVGERLSQFLEKPVKCLADCVGPEVEKEIGEMKAAEVILLENLRFHDEETKNDSSFAKSLASLAEVYVNDAFGTAHRAHASTAGVADYLPAVSGFLMEKELEFLGKALTKPARPFAMIVGGAKVADKIALLENIIEKVDVLVIGGGMANTFIKAQGYEVGSSEVEEDQLEFSRGLIRKAKSKRVNLVLPADGVAAEKFEADAAHRIVPIIAVPDGWMLLDIGPESIEKFKQELKECKTIVWNGPMGVFEFPAFSSGTKNIASFVAELDATTIIGGGDTAAAVKEMGVESKMTHVSTGGGASLEFLEGKILPGVAALLDK
ncbi:MAG: phosphoglycerate kinase [Dehalococcoidia bacterium]